LGMPASMVFFPSEGKKWQAWSLTGRRWTAENEGA